MPLKIRNILIKKLRLNKNNMQEGNNKIPRRKQAEKKETEKKQEEEKKVEDPTALYGHSDDRPEDGPEIEPKKTYNAGGAVPNYAEWVDRYETASNEALAAFPGLMALLAWLGPRQPREVPASQEARELLPEPSEEVIVERLGLDRERGERRQKGTKDDDDVA